MNFLCVLQPAVLTTEQAHAYVGGKKIWEELMAAYGPESQLKLLLPIRRTKRGDSSWRTKTLDKVLDVAEGEATLLLSSSDD